MIPPIYWRWRIISNILLSLIFFHILNRQSGSKGWNLSRHRLLIMLVQAEKEIWFLHKCCMFKLQIPIDRHSPILIPNQCYLSGPPHFSLPSPFNKCDSPFNNKVFYMPKDATKGRLTRKNAASCSKQYLPNPFISHVILPLRAMSVLAFYRSANHWLSDEPLSEERSWKSRKWTHERQRSMGKNWAVSG